MKRSWHKVDKQPSTVGKAALPVVAVLLLLAGLGACGDPIAPTEPAPTFSQTGPAQAGSTKNTAVSGPTARASTAPANSDEPSLTAEWPEKKVLRNWTDNQGRAVKLVYGRGTGHNGDYGWGHIYGKHVKGIWYDGGTITTFPKALGTKTPEEVAGLVRHSLADKSPDNAGNGRRSYVYPVPGTTMDVFTVVGNDGTIITSYPVKHGSKDENS